MYEPTQGQNDEDIFMFEGPATCRNTRWRQRCLKEDRNRCMSIWTWGSLTLNLGLILISAIIYLQGVPSRYGWKNLRLQTLTPDGKSFPVGHLTWHQSFQPLPCGASPVEAKARGCHFDIIATAWLPPRCIDWELISEFNAYHPWEYFKSFHGNETHPDSDLDELGSTSDKIWTTSFWHTAHCLFMWKKLNRALLSGTSTDAETVTQGHTDHCTKLIMESKEIPRENISGWIEVIYPPC